MHGSIKKKFVIWKWYIAVFVVVVIFLLMSPIIILRKIFEWLYEITYLTDEIMNILFEVPVAKVHNWAKRKEEL